MIAFRFSFLAKLIKIEYRLYLATISVIKAFSARLAGCGSAPPAAVHWPAADRCFMGDWGGRGRERRRERWRERETD